MMFDKPEDLQNSFQTEWDLEPLGDQPAAIGSLVEGLEKGLNHQVLLGVTGSGKTFTMANIIAKTQRPALIMAHNKTLAAQLFQEFKTLFPNNAVEYFVSYYDFYQPEAYIPSSNTYIAKTATINDDIDKMRHSATYSLFERRDTIIVSSVSCIYGLGAPDAYLQARVVLHQGDECSRDLFLQKLIQMNYMRNDISLERGKFRVRGDVVDVIPAYAKEQAVRVQFWGSKVEKIFEIDALRGTVLKQLTRVGVYPATHHVLNRNEVDTVLENIKQDLFRESSIFKSQNKFLEAQRLTERTLHDIDMIQELGFCPGVENYSRYLDGRKVGDPPSTLLDYFPKDYLLFIDESHVTLPQVGGMYRGDRMRKETLVNYGFRLAAALDNRPLNFEEFYKRMGQTIYVSATPGRYEFEQAQGHVVEQVIRPTGLLDPLLEVHPATGQIDHLRGEIQKTVDEGARVLVSVLTKKMAEDVTNYYAEFHIKVRYLHGDLQGFERVEILRDLRRGLFDVLVGVNLLREGLDLPEVSLVAIFDADKEGFLRNRSSLIQTVGRAARNASGRAILYGDRITDSMAACLQETERRRQKQIEHNTIHQMTPQTIAKKIPQEFKKLYDLDFGSPDALESAQDQLKEEFGALLKSPDKINKAIEKIKKEMQKASQKMEFEKAALLRDKIKALRGVLFEILEPDS